MASTDVIVHGQGDGRQEKRIGNYTDFWQKDISKDTTVEKSNRVDNYTDVINGEFSLVLHSEKKLTKSL